MVAHLQGTEAVEILTRGYGPATLRVCLDNVASYNDHKDEVKVAILTFLKTVYILEATVLGVVEINEPWAQSRGSCVGGSPAGRAAI